MLRKERLKIKKEMITFFMEFIKSNPKGFENFDEQIVVQNVFKNRISDEKLLNIINLTGLNKAKEIKNFILETCHTQTRVKTIETKENTVSSLNQYDRKFKSH